MKRTSDAIRRDLAEAQARLKRLQEHGDAAVSEYDLMMGYDAEFNIRLAQAHIASYEDQLREATKHGEQLSLGI